MFRFEVHLRITDENGQHIQHMSSATNPSESFLFTSLFDGEGGVMVGGTNHLSDFCADVSETFSGKSTAEALLSSLRADDICCGLVDDFVSRTAGKDDGILLVDQATWKMGFPGDWNIFVSSGDGLSSNETCHNSGEKFFQQNFTKAKHFKEDTSEEDRNCNWSSEEDQNIVEFDSEESKALWESLSKSSDPYNPFFFSACISTNTDMGGNKNEVKDSANTDNMSVGKASEERSGPRGLNIWISRSDSESSWTSSGSSSPDIDKEESERLWDFFSSPADPYNPLCFTACTISSTSPPCPTTTVSKAQTSLPVPSTKSDSDDKESSFPPSSSDEGGKEDEEEQLWRSLCPDNDPYHPLNFQACLQSSQSKSRQVEKDCDYPNVRRRKRSPTRGKNYKKDQSTSIKHTPSKPILPERQIKRHSHPEKTLVPWKRPGQTPHSHPEDQNESKTSRSQKKVIII